MIDGQKEKENEQTEKGGKPKACSYDRAVATVV